MRAFIWSLMLWLVAAWAGWLIKRQRKTLSGILPAAILLGLILNATDPRSSILWLFLSALIPLVGITNYQNLITPWEDQGTDFSDSIWEDSMVATLVLVLGLISLAYIISTFSFKEFIDRMRESQRVSTTTSLISSSPNGTTSHIRDTLPDNIEILGGRTLSSDIVISVSTGDFPPMQHAVDIDVPRYYWRTMTYQTYTSSGWINPSSTNEEIKPHQMLIQVTPSNYRMIHQVVSLPAGVNGGLYWTGALVQSDAPIQIAWRAQHVSDPAAAGFDPLLGGDLVGGRLSDHGGSALRNYTVESILPNVSEDDLRAAPAFYPPWVGQRYLALPDSVPERVRALARDITANAATPYDRALAIETYLRKYPYSLAVPAPPRNQDAADYFLFDLKKGYCDYYATAMTVLARTVDLPARLVIGYASGTYDPYNAQYVIRQTDAHAWTEIYFSGIGWIEFEPTANQPASFQVINKRVTSHLAPVAPDQPVWSDLSTFLTGRIYFPWKPIIGLIVIYILWVGSDGLRLSLYPPPEAIKRLFQRLRTLAQPISGDHSPNQTIREYTAALTGRLESLMGQNRLSNWLLEPALTQIGKLAELYTQSLFSPTPLTRANIGHALRIWGSISWRLFLIKLVFVPRPISLMR